MNAQRGYYSLIQYCPDLSRSEAANVGVILFCPAIRFLEHRLATTNERVKKFFGPGSYDDWALKKAKEALANRLKTDKSSFRELADLEAFVQTRANHLILTAPRPMKVTDAGQQLEELFQELVGDKGRREGKRPIVPQLHALFEGLAKEHRAELNKTVRVPILNRRFKAPYAYRNGALNLIKPERFSDSPTRAKDAAMKLAVEGDLLQRHFTEDGGTRFIVVAAFAGDSVQAELQSSVSAVLDEYKVRTVLPDGVTAFMDEVEHEAH